jgi:four helix bundle protein
MEKIEFIENFKKSTKQFALNIIKLTSELPNNKESLVIAKQLLRSATSVGANYRAASRSRSKAEFLNKMCIVVEEADECLYWIELLQESGIRKDKIIVRLYNECEEILKVVSAA